MDESSTFSHGLQKKERELDQVFFGLSVFDIKRERVNPLNTDCSRLLPMTVLKKFVKKLCTGC